MDPAALERFVSGFTGPFEPVLTRLWLLGPGDQCLDCPMRRQCPDRTRCLHLELSLGTSRRTHGTYRRVPLRVGALGRVALDGTTFVANGALATLGLADPTWLAFHHVLGFAAVPLRRADGTTGVLALFSRRRLGPREVAALEAAADLLAGAIPATSNPALAGHREERRTLAEIEREAIGRVLAQTGGRVSGPSGAARILGLKPTTLHSRMKKLGVRRVRT
jgi:regulatory Fis family protein/GAF domain-containing protein